MFSVLPGLEEMCAHFSSLKLFTHHQCVMTVFGYHVFWLRIEIFLHHFSGLFMMKSTQVKEGKGHFDSRLLNTEDSLIFPFYFVNNPSTWICVTHAQCNSFLIPKLKILLWWCPMICFLSDSICCQIAININYHVVLVFHLKYWISV